MTEEELKALFERECLKNSCFDSFDDLMKEIRNDNTKADIDIRRAMIAVNLKGKWDGMRCLLDKLWRCEQCGAMFEHIVFDKDIKLCSNCIDIDEFRNEEKKIKKVIEEIREISEDGILPDGDHVDTATMLWAERALQEIEKEIT